MIFMQQTFSLPLAWLSTPRALLWASMPEPIGLIVKVTQNIKKTVPNTPQFLLSPMGFCILAQGPSLGYPDMRKIAG